MMIGSLQMLEVEVVVTTRRTGARLFLYDVLVLPTTPTSSVSHYPHHSHHHHQIFNYVTQDALEQVSSNGSVGHSATAPGDSDKNSLLQPHSDLLLLSNIRANWLLFPQQSGCDSLLSLVFCRVHQYGQMSSYHHSPPEDSAIGHCPEKSCSESPQSSRDISPTGLASLGSGQPTVASFGGGSGGRNFHNLSLKQDNFHKFPIGELERAFHRTHYPDEARVQASKVEKAGKRKDDVTDSFIIDAQSLRSAEPSPSHSSPPLHPFITTSTFRQLFTYPDSNLSNPMCGPAGLGHNRSINPYLGFDWSSSLLSASVAAAPLQPPLVQCLCHCQCPHLSLHQLVSHHFAESPGCYFRAT
ncbi:hypothetical protein Ocin01_16982 [Orchesella cincta]|uniref:Uncharacterized protein n=1 Tax=Orchesella cincta TaxID=48709 RepID=A0A1D2M9U8_ORCCI|nr:hypothetical protein Ocin01_16982 [Orchesella cincta]